MEIDDPSKDFDANWDLSASGPEGITSFLNNLGFTNSFPSDLLRELVQIDIERNWMAWDDRLANLIDTQAPGELVQQLQSIPTLQNYQSLFSSAQEFNSSLEVLATVEIQCRHRFGDDVGPIHYLHYLSTVVQTPRTGKSVNAGCLIERKSIEYQVVFPVRGCTIFGRHNKHARNALAFEELPDGNRITIAGHQETEISRQHVQLQLLNPKFGVVRNLSSSGPFRCSGRVLAIEQAAIVKFPAIIKLPGRVLVVE